MYDFNFFQPYIKEPEKVHIKDIMILAIITIIVFMIIVYPILRYSEYRALKKDIMDFNSILESKSNLDKLKEIDELSLKLAELEDEKNTFEILEERLDSRNIIDDLLIYEILSQVPRDISFDQLKIDGDGIEIRGKSMYKVNIAQMEYNLRNSTHLDQVFIPSITENNGYYDFTITFIIKDVASDDIE